ncbi:hypothetical protein [Endozoicomonas sp. Mp262]
MIKDFEKLRQKLGIVCKNAHRPVRKNNPEKQINRINQLLTMRWK